MGKKKKEQSKWKIVTEYIVLVGIGLGIGAVIANYLSTLPLFQPRYVKPIEMQLDWGLLIGYLMGLIVMVVAGYLFARRIDNGTQRMDVKKGSRATVQNGNKPA